LGDNAGTFNAAPIGQAQQDIDSTQCPADNGASVGMMQCAVDYAISQGVTVVASAGNYSDDWEVFPAALSGVLSVASRRKEESRPRPMRQRG
jgi:hypothetical protein